MTADRHTGWDKGWWLAASRHASPNFDARPGQAAATEATDTVTAELVVLHHISLPPGVFAGDAVIDFFENRLSAERYPELAELVDVRVSAHFFVRRGGSMLQFVSCDDRAWHAGVSSWHGRTGCNDFSIGIEIEGDGEQPFADAQYTALNVLLDAIREHYPVAAVTSHSEIAAGRKMDPGPAFDWSRLDRRWNV